jgi:putative heme transporter
VQVRRDLADLVRVAGVRLTVGKLLYAAAQAALLWSCLAVVGTSPVPAVVFAAFAVERVLSLAVVTPGATGFVEIGMTTYLSRMGVEPATAAAGVLLYRFFVIGMEVPVGGALLLPWSLRQLAARRSRERGLGPTISSDRRPAVR